MKLTSRVIIHEWNGFCPGCGEEDFEEVDRADSMLKGDLVYYVCENCGTKFTIDIIKIPILDEWKRKEEQMAEEL